MEMNKKELLNNKIKIILGILIVIAMITLIALSYVIGYNVGNANKELPTCNEEKNNAKPTETFYAKITNIDGYDIEIDGLEVNDITYRDHFTLKTLYGTEYVWRDETIYLRDLIVGDTIMVTYIKSKITDNTINKIVKIQVLNDRLEAGCLENELGGYITSSNTPTEVNLKDLINVDMKNVIYSHIEVGHGIYAVLDTEDNNVISKLESYLASNYSGYKKLKVHEYLIYVYNDNINNEELTSLETELNSCFK